MTDSEEYYEYYLKSFFDDKWTKVSKEDFIKAERSAGFRPKISSDSPDYYTTLATSGFSGGSISGKLEPIKRNKN